MPTLLDTAGTPQVSPPDEFLASCERSYARRVAAERLPADVRERIDAITKRFADNPPSPAEIKGELLALAILVDDHAEQRHKAFCEQLSGRLEGTADA